MFRVQGGLRWIRRRTPFLGALGPWPRSRHDRFVISHFPEQTQSCNWIWSLCLKSFKSPAVSRRLPHNPTSGLQQLLTSQMIFCPHASRDDLLYCLGRRLLGAQWSPSTSNEDYSPRVRPHSQRRFRETTLYPKPTALEAFSILSFHYLPTQFTVRLRSTSFYLLHQYTPGARYCVLSFILHHVPPPPIQRCSPLLWQ